MSPRDFADCVGSSDLDALFRPRSIAIVGASQDASKIGGSPIDYLRRYGFDGRIVPVNPRHSAVQGLAASPSLTAIGEPVDLAIVSVPAKLVRGVLADAASAGVKAAVVFSSGFAEIDEAGRRAQADLTADARRHGIRLLGPNCMGLMSVRERAFSTFTPAIQAAAPLPGNIAIVSQSGAFGAFALQLARRRSLGLSYWVTTGNEADIELSDTIAWLAADPHTDVILCYMEGCRNGGKLEHALALALEQGKRIVVTKVGRTELGQAAAASHTAALTGEDAVYDAVFRQYGVYRASTIEEFFTVGYAASLSALPRSNRIGLLTVSGGVGALMADEASSLGLDACELPAAQQVTLRELVPFSAPRNPVDMTGQFTNDTTLLDRTIDLMIESGAFDMLPVFMAAAGASPVFGPKIVDSLLAARRRHPGIPLALISLIDAEGRGRLEKAGVLVFEDPSHAVRAFAALVFFSRASRSSRVARSASRARNESASKAAAELPAVSLPMAGQALNEIEALRLLGDAGIPVVDTRAASDAEEAVREAAAVGYPVVLKILSADIAHKTDIGGVRLRLGDAASVRRAFDEILASAHRAAPQARIDGVIVAPMVNRGIEMILGVVRDPVFGPIIMCGLGGVFAEVLRDTALRVAPIELDEAHAMLGELRGRRLLDGVRGAPPADVDALARAIVALSELAIHQDDAIDSLDINPFIVLAKGEGAMALDAMIVTAAARRQS